MRAVVAQSQHNGAGVAELFATLDAVKAQPEAATFRFSADNRRAAVYDGLTHGVPISVDVAAG